MEPTSPSAPVTSIEGEPEPLPPGWCVYVLLCRGNSLYTGSTNNLARRIGEHGQGKGSKFVRSRMPFEVVKVIPCENESSARRLEHRIKSLTRKGKIDFLSLHDRLP